MSATVTFICLLFTAFAVGCGVAGRADDAGLQSAAAPPPIPYSTLQVISSGDSDAVIAEKAAKVLPRPNQTAWMRLEGTFFIHFGPNTFRGVEWGDGLCLWPSRYTNHSVAASPWRGGKGDLVREVARACRKYGIKLGIYLSPADLYQLRTNPKYPGGYYGDESDRVRSVIPTDPASFKTDPGKGRPPAKGFPSFTYDVDDYNRYFLNQLYELLTEYGPIDDVWFDGANPDPSVHETYDYAAWYDLIRHLQPQAVITVKGPDVRWVGNEGGWGRQTEWSVIPLSSSPEAFTWPDMQGGDLGSLAKLTHGSYLWWYPAEINNPILYGWFWAAKKPVRTAAELIDIYYRPEGCQRDGRGRRRRDLRPARRIRRRFGGLIPASPCAIAFPCALPRAIASP